MMENEFVLNKVNRIYSGVLAVVCLIFLLSPIRSEYSPSHFAYNLAGYFVGPLIIASVLRAIGINQKRSNLVYSLTVSIFLLIDVIPSRQSNKISDQELSDRAHEFKYVLKTSEDQVEIQNARKSMMDLMRAHLSSSNTENKDIYESFFRFFEEWSQYTENWEKSLVGISNDDFFDYSLWHDPKEIQKRRAKLKEFIKLTEEYIKAFESQADDLSIAISRPSHTEAIYLINQLQVKNEKKLIYLKPMMEAYLRYADNLIELLNLIDDPDEWSFVGEEVLFKSDEACCKWVELWELIEIEWEIILVNEELTFD